MLSWNCCSSLKMMPRTSSRLLRKNSLPLVQVFPQFRVLGRQHKLGHCCGNPRWGPNFLNQKLQTFTSRNTSIVLSFIRHHWRLTWFDMTGSKSILFFHWVDIYLEVLFLRVLSLQCHLTKLTTWRANTNSYSPIKRCSWKLLFFMRIIGT